VKKFTFFFTRKDTEKFTVNFYLKITKVSQYFSQERMLKIHVNFYLKTTKISL